MDIYIIWAILGFMFMLIEMMMPSMFFLNIAAAGLFTAVLAWVAPDNYVAQTVCFVVLSTIFIVFLRPLMLSKQNHVLKTGMDSKYIGQEAIVTKTIGEEGTSGVGEIKIYGEIWQATSQDNTKIAVNSKVEITGYKSIVMIVKIKGE